LWLIANEGIHGLSHILIDKHDGKVPQSFESLEELPAVGHKTASVVMSQAFGVPAFPVDTHIHRLMYRWNLTNGKMWYKQRKMLNAFFQRNFGMTYTCRLFGTEGIFSSSWLDLDQDIITKTVGRKLSSTTT
jgi:endonuclease-3